MVLTLSASEVIEVVKAAGTPTYAEVAQRFFKTDPGQYGAGDVFWGVRNPQARAIAKQYGKLTLKEVHALLDHQVHEVRMVGVLILVEQFKKAKTSSERSTVYEFYTHHFARINNWDLVDLSAHIIVGEHCAQYGAEVLYDWVQSDHLWTRRIAVVACWHLIKKDRFDEILSFCLTLKDDPESLMHKACGWMLREVGKRDVAALRNFLEQWGKQLPRTTIRYAIERFPESERLTLLSSTKNK
jgi:3-methyladenine DNA glycosylase AlkD